ncbi:MAG TPA: GNAT family N-acetyltransferase [Nannocystaceae bacterium]|nr:GNAT family N-acetyltransferase [Nannocystaceae bacterium]
MSLTDLELLQLCYEGEDRLLATGERPIVPDDHGLVVVHLIESPPPFAIDAAIVRSDRRVERWLHDANPGNWHPIEWLELLDGRLGPWAMVVAERRVLSICHTPVPLTAATAEPGTWTTPDARGRGYAAAATAEWVAMLRPSGRRLFYVHDVANRSSQRVAERLRARMIGWAWHRGPPARGRDVHPLSSVRDDDA